MEDLIQFVARNGYLVIFIGVFIEQIGIPLPSNLLLIVAGALAGLGQLDFTFVIITTVFAALLGDTIWYYIGRSRGYQVLKFLCKISLEPDSCISKAKSTFTKHGERSLVVAKFVPGFSTFAQPLAGATEMSLPRFLIFDGLGSLFWVLVFVSLGYIFSEQLEWVGEFATGFGWWFGLIIVVGLSFYFGWKYAQRRRFIKNLRVSRITPEELKSHLDSGVDVLIIDLRDPLDFNSNPVTIPKAIRLPPAELEEKHHELPRDRDVILYCT